MAHETRAGILAGKPTLSPPIDTTERGVTVMVDEHSETEHSAEIGGRIVLCVTPSKCTCGAPADTPSGMHHDHCAANPASPDGTGCQVCKIPASMPEEGQRDA